MAPAESSSSELDQRVVRALANPLRLRILQALDGGTASPSELAEQLGEPIGKVSYHVQVLKENGAIELARTRPVRGAVEHFYRPLMRPFLDGNHQAKLPSSARRTLLGQVVERIFADVARAAGHHGFDATHASASRTVLTLDAQGHDELAAAVTELLERTSDIQARAAARLDGEAPAQRTELALLHFDLPDGDGVKERGGPDGDRAAERGGPDGDGTAKRGAPDGDGTQERGAPDGARARPDGSRAGECEGAAR